MIKSIARISGAAALSGALLFSTTSMASSAEDEAGSTNPSSGSVEVISGEDFEAGQNAIGQNAIEGTQKSALAAKAGCAGPWSGYAGITWTTTHQKNCNIFGSPGYKKTYKWYVPNFSSGRACAQGKGLKTNGTNKWYAIGCGKSGSGKVNWGNWVAYPSYKAKSLALPLGTPTLWR